MLSTIKRLIKGKRQKKHKKKQQNTVDRKGCYSVLQLLSIYQSYEKHNTTYTYVDKRALWTSGTKGQVPPSTLKQNFSTLVLVLW